MLQKHKQCPVTYGESLEAPEARIQEAALFHQFAEAAYTVRSSTLTLFPLDALVQCFMSFLLQGPLLDFGRNPVLFPCVWLYRQGALTPWTCRRFISCSSSKLLQILFLSSVLDEFLVSKRHSVCYSFLVNSLVPM